MFIYHIISTSSWHATIQEHKELAALAQPARTVRVAAIAATATTTPLPAAVAAPQQDVSVTDEMLPKSQMQLTVTVSPRLCTAQYNKEIAYFQKNTTVPGFRKGGKGRGKKVSLPLVQQETMGDNDKTPSIGKCSRTIQLSIDLIVLF